MWYAPFFIRVGFRKGAGIAVIAFLILCFANMGILVRPTTVMRRSFEDKVALSSAILRVSVTEVIPPPTNGAVNPLFPHANTLVRPGVWKAKVLEVLKGPTNLMEIEFRGGFPSPKSFVGRECFIFLHERPIGGTQSQLWLLEAPRLVAKEYTELRYMSDLWITEEFSHSNYVATIRALSKRNATARRGP